LVTLTGAGGCGKTRLGLEVARELVDRFADGVWLVELGSLAEPSLVPQTIATALNVAERRGRTPLESLVAAHAERNALIVLDNCEHLIDACARAIESLLNGCPHLFVLATSREQLRIRDEVRWPVPSLALDDANANDRDAASYPAAVQLFVERTQSVRPDYVCTAHDIALACQICTRLDGLPLAIELAAARMRTLGIEEIAERLQDSFQLLVDGSRTAPARQQTLKATLDWSHALLNPSQQRVFRRLAVFAGTWGVDLAEAVCGDASDGVLEALGRLVDLSLVLADHRAGRIRHHLLEPVRHYAFDRLVESGELDALRRRHALVVIETAERMEASARGVGSARRSAWPAIELLYPNLQVALRWCLEQGDMTTALRGAAAAHFLWTMRRPPSEGLDWLTRILALPGPTDAVAAHASAYSTAGRLATKQGSYAQARRFFDLALPLARQSGDAFALSMALQLLAVDCVDRGAYAEGRVYLDEALALAVARGNRLEESSCRANLGWLACLGGDYTTARQWSDEAISLARTLGDDWTLGWQLQCLGYAACAQGDLAAARAALIDTLPLWQHTGEQYGMAWTHEGLGNVALAEGAHDEAAAHYRSALLMRQQMGDLPGIADCLDGIGGVLARRKRLAEGVRLAAAAEALRESLPLPLGPLRRDLRERWLPAARTALGEPAGAEAWHLGGRLTVDDAIACAHAALGPAPVSQAAAGPLTPREQVVAALVADGLSNRQIAETLVIAERTAATHIEHILAKLDFTSRTQIAIWAAEHGLKNASRTPAARVTTRSAHG
jgi:predicted ATPase/DNA-binding CsgD family transcriptional regulator